MGEKTSGSHNSVKKRLTVEAEPEYLGDISRRAKNEGVSIRQYVLDSLKLRIGIEALAQRNWTITISDNERRQVASVPAHLAIELFKTNPDLLSALLQADSSSTGRDLCNWIPG